MFHIGVLRALEERAGFAGTDAALMVGTSAGSPIAALARRGLTAADIEHAVARPPTADERREMMNRVRSMKRTWRPVAPHLVRSITRLGPMVAFSGLMPPGIFPTDSLGRMGDLHHAGEWPDGLWIPAVRTSDGARIVFGRDRSAPLSDAIEASSALPVMFQPKAINGHHFFDGGAASPTNADLALEIAPDTVIVSSPMTRQVRRPLAAFARSRLAGELELLRDAQIATLVIEPPSGADTLFREFPRTRWEAGAEIMEIGRRTATAALSAVPLG
jgi:NTE family protein